jgi:hypothetical protein
VDPTPASSIFGFGSFFGMLSSFLWAILKLTASRAPLKAIHRGTKFNGAFP